VVLGAALALACRMGPGEVATALGCTEQLSRIRSGWPRSMPIQAETLASSRGLTRRARQRRRVRPLAAFVLVSKLCQGAPSRRTSRSVAKHPHRRRRRMARAASTSPFAVFHHRRN
jgi:hypothetical protein